MKAQFGTSICGLCQQKIAKGSEIVKFENKWCHQECVLAKEKKQEPIQEKPKKEKLEGNKLKVTSPMFEAEILTKYYRNISYKIVYSEVDNINSLSTDQLRSMQIERNMLTKILLSTDLRLREINNIKSEYAKKN